tara:strand:- start:27 stop:782 length:756 start_codon:yes stop_codon:yes gene_type:complete
MLLTASPQLDSSNSLRIVVAKEDRLYGECLKQNIENSLRNAEVNQVGSLTEAQAVMHALGRCDLLVCGVGFRDGDSLEWLEGVVSSRSASRVLIVTACRKIHIISLLREITLNGLLDPVEAGLEELSHALDFVLSGGYYLSPSFHELLHSVETSAVELIRNLTAKEQLVMGAIGDGSDDAEAAGRLGMSTAAVRSHRKRLHTKLGISHRGELMRIAFTHGFVRVINSEIVRPGFASLMKKVSRPPWEPRAG